MEPGSTPARQLATDKCEVPGCDEPRAEEDCCTYHTSDRPFPGVLPNDGVIDWLAIDLLLEGARHVNVTWVERDIAAARLLAQGCGSKIVFQRLGFNLKSVDRRQEVEKIARAIANGC